MTRTLRALGSVILRAAPWMMKGLSVAGTAAMFLVGGSILSHGIGPLHHWLEGLALATPVPLLIDGLTGIIAGALVAGAIGVAGWYRRRQ